MKAASVGWVALAVVMCVASQAEAWNSIGHFAISKLALDELPEAKQVRLFQILKSHPHYEEFLAFGRPENVSLLEWVVVRASIWPDWVRLRPNDPRGSRVTKYHRGEDHYINLPFVDPKDTDFFAGKPLQNLDAANIVSALQQRANDLATKNADPSDQAVSACWVFHLVGDIHQPMHAVSYYSSHPGYQQGDQGGNKIGILAAGKKIKLHAFWDDLFGDDPDYLDDSPNRQNQIYQRAIAVAGSLRMLALADDETAKLEAHPTFSSWAQESFELAKKVAYTLPDGTLIQPGDPVPFKGPFPANAPTVGDDYIRKARATADVRAVLAGKRLAQRIAKLL